MGEFDTMSSPGGGETESGQALRSGAVVAGFEIQEEIGRGGMGVVYRARDLSLNRDVALKLISPHLSEDKRFRQRFTTESELAAAVENPYVLPVFSAGESDELLYTVLKLVPDGDLKEGIASGQIANTDEAAQIVTQVASALDSAHAQGLIHRDVKPGNVLIDRLPNGSVHSFLADFGLSKAASEVEEVTATGELIGSPEYMSPEQVAGGEVGPATDQYALACIAFELLFGFSPYRREGRSATLMAHLRDLPPWPDAGKATRNRELKAVLSKGLELHPEKRYPDCSSFARDLARTIPRDEELERLPPPAKLRRRVTRRRRVLTGVALIAAALVGASVVTLFASSEKSPRKPPRQRLLYFSPDRAAIVSATLKGRDERDLTFGTSSASHITVAPDGDLVAFVDQPDNSQLVPYLRLVSSANGTSRVVGIGRYPIFSSDGAHLCFTAFPGNTGAPSSTSPDAFSAKCLDLLAADPGRPSVADLGRGSLAAIRPDGSAALVEAVRPDKSGLETVEVALNGSERRSLGTVSAVGYSAAGNPVVQDAEGQVWLLSKDGDGRTDLGSFDSPTLDSGGRWLIHRRGGAFAAMEIDSREEQKLGGADEVTPAHQEAMVFLLELQESGASQIRLVDLNSSRSFDLGSGSAPSLAGNKQVAVIQTGSDDRGSPHFPPKLHSLRLLDSSTDSRLPLTEGADPHIYRVGESVPISGMESKECRAGWFTSPASTSHREYSVEVSGMSCGKGERLMYRFHRVAMAKAVSNWGAPSRFKFRQFDCIDGMSNFEQHKAIAYSCLDPHTGRGALLRELGNEGPEA